ncbi:hypothetical protein [Arthrobacter sp. H14-L1]|uniref:hypothetical protein n=1 Tax=Arthrobacter sp. H14-L1 TaxID=2996697 RepID=UPI00226D79A7|nr:hypothetical protein [Arthrobacter sp. H14-L1]
MTPNLEFAADRAGPRPVETRRRSIAPRTSYRRLLNSLIIPILHGLTDPRASMGGAVEDGAASLERRTCVVDASSLAAVVRMHID